MVCSCRKATGNLRKTGVYHDGRNVSLGQGRLNGVARAGARLVWFGPVRSVKRENAENQRARIAPGLDQHGIGGRVAGIGWRGLAGGDRLAGSVASGPMDPFGDAERSVIMGGTCACHAATLLPLG